MIYFREKLLNEGTSLLNTCRELGDLAKDANELFKWIMGSINQYNYQEALALNKKMREKYLEIEPLEYLANRFSTKQDIDTNFF